MAYIMKRWIVYIIILLAAAIYAGNDTSIRLAVLAEDVSLESRALSDLLTTDLSKAAGVQVVERAEIDRVLAEQKLTAGGLVETASRIQLGRLLKADGLVLIRKDDARQTRVLVRTVETKSGFLAGYYQYPLNNVTMDKLTGDASAEIRTSLHKLRADPAKMQRVAISRIGNATLRADYDWLESEVSVLLAMTFSAEPGVLLMERRQLGEALNEANLTGDKSELKSGNVLIDGEVALSYGQTPKDGSVPIVMILRFRNATLKEIGRVSREGHLTDLDKLTTETMALALTKLREFGQRPAEKASAEPEMLLAMAKRHGYVWAADAAYALNPTNIAAKNQLITQLLSEALTPTPIAGYKSLQDYLVQAKKLVRAEKLCREENSLLVNYVQNTQLEGNFIGFLSQPQTMLDADIRAALKPLRKTYRRETETQQAGKKPDLIKLMRCASAFFDNPFDYISYTRGVYETMSRSANTDEDRRKAAISAITRCLWPPELYFDMADTPDPVIRYFALTKLMRFYGNRATRKEYALQAVGCFDDALKFSHCLADMDTRSRRADFAHFFYQTIGDMMNSCPDLLPSITAKLCAELNEALDTKDYRLMIFLKPQNYIPLLPLSNSVPLADRILAEREAILPKQGYDSRITDMIQKVAEWRRTNDTRCATSAGANEPVKTWVLLSSESSEWRQMAGQLAPVPSIDGYLTVIVPQRFLIDGDILWIGLGGCRVPKKPDMNATGLMKLDLTTGRILACRFGQLKGDTSFSAEVFFCDVNRQHYVKSVLPIFKWHDYIVVGQNGVGVFLYPLRSDSTVTDLSGVTIINQDTGLMSNHLISIAALDERLFIMTGPGIAVFKKDGKWMDRSKSGTWLLFDWHRKTKTVRLIADSEKQIGGMELQDIPRGLLEMTADPTNNCLYFKSRDWIKERRRLLYSPSAEHWSLMATNAMPRSFFPACAPKDYKETYDVQNYKGGTLAIASYGEHWKLVFFHRAGDETAARWAQTQPTTPVGVPTATVVVSTVIEAARAGDIPCLQQMISQGASINTHNENGYTLLIYAIDKKQSDAALWLIQQGADINMTGRDGGTPLTYAACRDLTNVVVELLARNADPNSGFNNGQTALMLAAANGNLDMVKQLIAKGARTTSMDENGRTAFTWSANASKPDVLIYFLRSVSDKPSLNKALFRAVMSSQTNNIVLLLKHGADINTTDSNAKKETGSPLLLLAAQYSKPDTVQYLLDAGFDIEATNSWGASPLMEAARCEQIDNVRVLLCAGANVLKTDEKGRSIYDNSKDCSQPEICAVIFEAVGKYVLKTFDDQDDHISAQSSPSSP